MSVPSRIAMLTVWPVSSESCWRWVAAICRSSIELIAENPRSSTRGPRRYLRDCGFCWRYPRRASVATYRCDVLLVSPSTRASSLIPSSGVAGLNAERIAKPRSRDWDWPEPVCVLSRVAMIRILEERFDKREDRSGRASASGPRAHTFDCSADPEGALQRRVRVARVGVDALTELRREAQPPHLPRPGGLVQAGALDVEVLPRRLVGDHERVAARVQRPERLSVQLHRDRPAAD